jgi:hypothetical protein
MVVIILWMFVCISRLVRLKSSTQNYSNAIYTTLFNSNSASIEFANILEDPLSENGFEIISKQMQSAHGQLNSERQTALTTRMQEGVLIPLDKIILHLVELSSKVSKRNELHTNLEYYLGKVHELNKEREERSSKGKSESSSQREKMDRNQHKLDGVRTEYTNFTAPLIKELLGAYEGRAAQLGPILAAFASIEKEYVQIYSNAIDQVHPEQVGVQSIAGGAVASASAAGLKPSPSPLPANVATGVSPAPPIMQQQQQPIQQYPSQDSHGAGSSNVFGEINEQNQTPPQQQPPQEIIISQPVGAGVPNPFDQQKQYQYDQQQHSGVEGSGLNNPVSTIDSTQKAALNKPEHEDESKRQRYEEEQKLQPNIIGV